jgi:KaiC/GvpD/RAD55 family RecA-like ATPase
MPLAEGQSLNADVADYVGAPDQRKIPTGISALDAIVDGGLPAGSTVLLLGEAGAGAHEFVYTGAAKLSLARERPVSREWLLGVECRDSWIPRHTSYVTFSRSRDAVLQEFSASFNHDYYDAFVRSAVFKDLSASYFRNTPVPSTWTFSENPFEAREEGLLEGLMAFLDAHARDTIVVIDSLTDLVEVGVVENKDLVTAVKGIARAAKTWDGVVYLLLTKGIAEPRLEQSLIDSVDGCIGFEWRAYLNSSKRQRYMHFDKFTAVLPHLAEKKIARFPVRVMSRSGLVVDYLERIS